MVTRFQQALLRRIALGVVAVLAVVGLLVVVVAPFARLRDALFGTDRPVAGDVALLEIRRTAELRSATGSYSVPVYFGVKESGLNRYIPDVIDGNSGVAIYQGSVDALIDLGALTGDNVVADIDAKTLTLRVPKPVLTSPNIDEEASNVLVQNRGLVTRLADLFDGAPLATKEALDAAAVQALRDAASKSSLEETATDNGRSFLVGLGRSLGYETVNVEFTSAP